MGAVLTAIALDSAFASNDANAPPLQHFWICEENCWSSNMAHALEVEHYCSIQTTPDIQPIVAVPSHSQYLS